MSSSSTFFVFSLWVAVAVPAIFAATNVNQCESNQDVKNKITIQACVEPPCRLRKGYNSTAEISFKPETDVKNLRTRVFAYIAGLPIPFIGVDGKTACNNLYKADKKTKVSCPLKKGETYVYSAPIPVLKQYPQIAVNVHWALTNAATNKDVICFEVPVRITN